jgi:hypothetical protein
LAPKVELLFTKGALAWAVELVSPWLVKPRIHRN